MWQGQAPQVQLMFVYMWQGQAPQVVRLHFGVLYAQFKKCMGGDMCVCVCVCVCHIYTCTYHAAWQIVFYAPMHISCIHTHTHKLTHTQAHAQITLRVR